MAASLLLVALRDNLSHPSDNAMILIVSVESGVGSRHKSSRTQKAVSPFIHSFLKRFQYAIEPLSLCLYPFRSYRSTMKIMAMMKTKTATRRRRSVVLLELASRRLLLLLSILFVMAQCSCPVVVAQSATTTSTSTTSTSQRQHYLRESIRDQRQPAIVEKRDDDDDNDDDTTTDADAAEYFSSSTQSNCNSIDTDGAISQTDIHRSYVAARLSGIVYKGSPSEAENTSLSYLGGSTSTMQSESLIWKNGTSSSPSKYDNDDDDDDDTFAAYEEAFLQLQLSQPQQSSATRSDVSSSKARSSSLYLESNDGTYYNVN